MSFHLMTQPKSHCVFPECVKPIAERSVCGSHYRLMQRVIQKGKRTWQEFEQAGYCTVPKRGKTSPLSIHFYKTIEKLKKRT